MRFLIIILFHCCFSFLASAQPEEQPNILWITIEDTSPHFIGGYGNKNAKTPNIDRLIKEGVKFTSAFANAPVCSSARSTIITGALNETLGTGNHRSNYPLPKFIKGFPTFLKEKGWYTSNNVKTDYATSDSRRIIKESWHESSNDAGWWDREINQPFFCVFNHVDSHQSRTMTNPYPWYQKFVREELDDKMVVGENEFEMPPYLKDSPEMRKHIARIYNSIALTDKRIGLLLDSLEDDGLMDETIIFLYGDHGEAIPGGKSGSVGVGYKVPLIIRFPEKFKYLSPWEIGTVSDELINFDDLGPTILSIARIEIPDYMTGRPILGNYRKAPEQFIFTSRNRIDETPDLTRSVTDGEFMYSKVFMPQFPELKYQKYADVSDVVQQIRNDHQAGVLNRRQSAMLEERATSEYLFNLKADPWKLHNLADEEKYRNKTKDLRNILFKHILDVRDVMFLPEYSIDQLSRNTTAFEYRQTQDYNLPELLKTAALTGHRKNAKQLLRRLDMNDPHVLYWTLMGLHGLKKIDFMGKKDKIVQLIDHDYPPVQVLASVIAFNNFENEKAEAKIKSFLANDNPLIVLQTIQLIQYTNGFSVHFQGELQKLIKIKKEDDAFMNAVNAAETMLFYENNSTLYYDRMKKWINFEK
jgi:arylsulfatase A-like enzyme